MTIMIMSDIHYEKDFHHGVWEGEAKDWILKMVSHHKPTDLVICGDTGYGWDEEEWETLLENVRVHAIYGNHDNVPMLQSLRNEDRLKVWPKDAEVRTLGNYDTGRFSFGFINGIMALTEKAKRKNAMFYENYKGHKTEVGWVPRKMPEEYLAAADILAQKKIDVLITHASIPFPSDGKRFSPTEEFVTLNQAVNRIRPRLWFSGHLSGPYATLWAEDTTYVRIDSSPQEKHYAILKRDEILIYHNREVVERVEYQ
jgi:predicted phosphodiesterase